MSTETTIDKRLVRRSFEKAAAGYDAAAVLQHEICRRMLSRLDYIKHEPALILDAGSGTGNVIAGLRTRYPQATLVALDLALAMVRRASTQIGWWQRLAGRAVLPVCGDIEALPVRTGAVGMVWSNLALQWVSEPQHAFAEMRRVLAPGGLLMFSTFGPDTLKELRQAYEVDRYTHVNRFIDMHDLKAIGAHNVNAGRPSGMTTRAKLAAVERNYERLRRDGRLPATFEVVYGHAWAPQPRTTADGKPVIPIKPVAR